MLHSLSGLALAPVLLGQGRYVRRVTPRLSEPAGKRAGTAGAGKPLNLLILGDSAAAGVGVERQAEALSGQLVSALAPSFRVRWKLVAETGRNSRDLLHCLACEKDDRFDAVLVSVGVNDVTDRTSLPNWQANIRALAEQLGSRFGARRILFTSVPPMHLFPALPQPLRWYLGTRAKQLNAIMEEVCGQVPGCEQVSVPFPVEKGHVNEGYMASDGFHPGDQAYALWGRHCAELIRQSCD